MSASYEEYVTELEKELCMTRFRLRELETAQETIDTDAAALLSQTTTLLREFYEITGRLAVPHPGDPAWAPLFALRAEVREFLSRPV